MSFRRRQLRRRLEALGAAVAAALLPLQVQGVEVVEPAVAVVVVERAVDAVAGRPQATHPRAARLELAQPQAAAVRLAEVVAVAAHPPQRLYPHRRNRR